MTERAGGTRELVSDGTPTTLKFDYLTRRRSFEELRELALRSSKAQPRSSLIDEEMWRAFPRGYVGVWVDGHLRGVILLWPLDARQAGDFLVGARSESELTAEDFSVICNSPNVVWYFAGFMVHPEWRGRGMAAHLFAEAMVRWTRDLPWWAPVHFAALGASDAGLQFIDAFGMEEVRPAEETADGMPLFIRKFQSEQEMREVVKSARVAADRKGRLAEAE
jgi:GNAT superfamily N-acetyltransferase